MARARGDKESVVVTEIPFQVNKSRLIEYIAELVRDKKLEGISDLRNESDRDGLRIVIDEARKAANISREVSSSEVVDLSILREAQRELGGK